VDSSATITTWTPLVDRSRRWNRLSDWREQAEEHAQAERGTFDEVTLAAALDLIPDDLYLEVFRRMQANSVRWLSGGSSPL